MENAYSQYLSSHSGYSNAYTAATSTNYYFEIAAKPTEEDSKNETESSPLHGALDRFAQFFIEPLFLSSTLDRELRAVDSENKKNLQSDTWRMHQLDKSLSNPKHPYCHFSTGNLETLKTEPEARGVDVSKAFTDFHAEHYSANRMKLVVLGRESLDTLESWVAELFAGVKNKSLDKKRWDGEQPLGENELLTQVFAKPVMDSRSMDLYFPYMDEEDMYETQPSRYISHLIGHEGPGSILSYIKNKGWANSLSCGGYPVCPGTAFMHIAVGLTEVGLEHYKEVLKVIFQYISLLKEAPPQRWIFDEQKGMADVDFKFTQKAPASKFTSHISSVMQQPLPRELLLSGSSKLRKFDASAIEKGLSFLRPDNFRISIVSQKFPGEWPQKEKWYGTEYKYEKIPASFVAEIKTAGESSAADRLPELHLPHKNDFIPTKLEVEKKEVKTPAKSPKLIRNDEYARAWYKKDDTFWVPKANFYIVLRNPLPAATAENAVKARLFTDLVKDALDEYSYDAELAGLNYGIESTPSGLSVTVHGYNDKLSVLLEKVLITLRDLKIQPDRFDIMKEKLERRLRNWDFQQPYNQVGEFTRWLNSDRGLLSSDLLADLPAVTSQDVQSFAADLLRQFHVDTLAHGNLYKRDALALTDLILRTLSPRPLPLSQWPLKRALLFPPGADYRYEKPLKDPANVNHCIEYILQVGDRTDRASKALLLLTAQMTEEPAFDQLRTKEQLGYVVFTGLSLAATTHAYRVIIQSERTPEYLETRIDAFLEGFVGAIEQMSDGDFESYKRAAINKRLENLKYLDQESDRLWQHITAEYVDFESGTFFSSFVPPPFSLDVHFYICIIGMS